MNNAENYLAVEGICAKSPHPVVHAAEGYGLSLPGTGNGIKMCVVDSGVPDHDAIVNIAGHINFTGDKTYRDFLGHSTAVAGLVAGNKPDHIQGVSPDSVVYFSKAMNDQGEAAFDATIASVLWGVVKEVNVILIPYVLEPGYTPLQNAIDRAGESNICVVMASSERWKKSGVKYNNTLSVTPIPTGASGAYFVGPLQIACPTGKFQTTYLEQQYASVAGIAAATAIVGGACCLAAEALVKERKEVSPMMVFKRLADSTAGEKK